MGLIVESTEVIIATDQGIVKAGSYTRKVDGERWNKEYLSEIKGVPWEPNPGSSDCRINASLKPDRIASEPMAKEAQVREPVSRGLYINKSDLQPDKYGLTPGCKGCIASNRGRALVPHDDRCRFRIEDMIKEN